MARALIIGCQGQDGRYLWQFLEKAGYAVAGIARNGAIGSAAEGLYGTDLQQAGRVRELVTVVAPTEIYYLAAYHHSSEGLQPGASDLLHRSFEVNTFGLINVLAAMEKAAPSCRLFYAGSSHVFGEASNPVQDESTPFRPVSPYGISKAAGIHVCRYYRSERTLHASAGILYNHESPLRPPHFVSKKIVRAAVRIRKGLQEKVTVGNLDAEVDWGYAPDYVQAMWAILQLECPDDFIIASGTLHTVGDLVQTVFDILQLDWKRYVLEDPVVIRKRPAQTLRGSIEKIRSHTGWQPQTSFRRMLEEMIELELSHE